MYYFLYKLNFYERVVFPYCILKYWFIVLWGQKLDRMTERPVKQRLTSTSHNFTVHKHHKNTQLFCTVKQIFFTLILNPTSVSNVINKSLKK